MVLVVAGHRPSRVVEEVVVPLQTFQAEEGVVAHLHPFLGVAAVEADRQQKILVEVVEAEEVQLHPEEAGEVAGELPRALGVEEVLVAVVQMMLKNKKAVMSKRIRRKEWL